MNPEQALQIIEQVRQRTQLAGADHDALRQAVQVLQGVIVQCSELQKQVVDLTAKLAKSTANPVSVP
jgi:hypothetical protein